MVDSGDRESKVGLIGISEWWDVMNKGEGLVKGNYPHVFDMNNWGNSGVLTELGGAEWGSSEVTDLVLDMGRWGAFVNLNDVKWIFGWIGIELREG